MKKHGLICKASYNGNKFIVQSTTKEGATNVIEGTTNVEFTLEGSILSGEFNSEKDSIIGISVANLIADCIGQLHGYKDGDLFSTLNSKEIENYTVEDEGYELKKLSNGGAIIKMDINKKVPLLDFSNVYIEESDLEDFKEYIYGEGFAEWTKGNVYFNSTGYDNEKLVIVAEKDKLTENAYKSICSIIKVMFDSEKAVEYFEENYPNISTGNKEFKGIKIEVNPDKTNFEQDILGNDDEYKFIRITVDKDIVRTQIKEGNAQNNQIDDSIAENITTLPQTGSETNYTVVTLYVLLAISIFTLIIINVKARKTK